MDIDISTIKVPELFRKNPPAEKKVTKKINAIINNTIEPMTVLEDKTLVDGYATYVAYRRLECRMVPVKFESISKNIQLVPKNETIKDMIKENAKLHCIIKEIKDNQPTEEDKFNEKVKKRIGRTKPVMINFGEPLNEEEEHVREITQNLLGGSKLGNLYKRQNGRCYICGRVCTYPSQYGKKKRRDTNASIEHMIPRAFGGNDSPDNIKMTCTHCNGLKGCSRYTHYLQISICKDLLDQGKISQERFDYILGDCKELYYEERRELDGQK